MRANHEIRPLTGLRGVAAIYVLVFHYFPLPAGAAAANPMSRFVSHGYLAVDLFFVLSGFVMAMTYAKDFANGYTSRRYRHFLGRRLARIYPLYIGTAAAGLGLIAAHRLPYEHTVPAIVAGAANVLMVQAWGIAPSFDSPAWSISAEWAAYLVFPLLLGPMVFAATRIRWVAASVCVCAIVALGSLPAAVLPDYLQRDPLNFNGYWLGFPVLRCVPEFALGIAAFGVGRTALGKRIASSPWIAPLLCLVLATLLALPRTDIGFVVLLPVLIVSLMSERNVPGKLLATPPLVLAGTLSFSIYLIHKLLIGVLQALTAAGRSANVPHAAVGAAVCCFAVTCALAFAAYHWIERPSRRLLRAWFEPAARSRVNETADEHAGVVALHR